MKKLLLLPLLFLSFAQAETTHSCAYRKIIDGNTVLCEANSKTYVKVKLYQIYAPDMTQPYGKKAKEFLDDHLMLLGQNKVAIIKGKDKDNTPLAIIVSHVESFGYSEDPNVPDMSWHSEDINLRMIESGYAWYYPFNGENPIYQKAEQEARNAKFGLWADKNPIAPWEWRKKVKRDK